MLMRCLIYIVFTVWVNPLLAKEPLLFKAEWETHISWLTYVCLLVILFITVLILSRYVKKQETLTSHCKIIERMTVHHKTKLYVIDYHGQRFLLADNQHGLTIQCLQTTDTSHEQ